MGEKEVDLGLGDLGPTLGLLLAFCEALGKCLHLLAPQFPPRRLTIAATSYHVPELPVFVMPSLNVPCGTMNTKQQIWVISLLKRGSCKEARIY